MTNTIQEFRHELPVQIRFNDMDILGHVNNAVYQHYYDLARLDYFGKVIGTRFNWKEFGLVMASIAIDFFKPVKMDEQIAVRSRVSIIGDKSITMVQELFALLTGEVKSKNTAIMAGFSTIENQTLALPETWKEKIFSYERSVEFKYPVKSL